MTTAPQNDELIDVVVRLPRNALEKTLLSTPTLSEDRPRRRLGAARAVSAGRRRRAVHFRGVYFSDPSWDMILELYIASCEHRDIGISGLCKCSLSSMTTALRHIEHLEALGYIRRQADPDDRRRSVVVTLAPLLTAVDQWLDLQISEPLIQYQRPD